MKSCKIFLLCFMSLSFNLSADDSRIERVTVFEDRARVSRTMNSSFEPGATSVMLERLPASIVETSVRARISEGTARVLGVRLEAQFHLEDVQEEVARLDAELLELRYQTDQLQISITAEKRLLHLIDRYAVFLGEGLRRRSTVGGALTEATLSKMLSAEAWVAEQQLSHQQKLARLQQERIALDEKSSDLRHMRNKVANPRGRESRTAVILVESDGTSQGTIEVSYDVPEASWKSIYEARLDETTGDVAWISNAEVRQQSGEKWDGVDLTLSTARSSLGMRVGTLIPRRVDIAEISRDRGLVASRKAPAAEAPGNFDIDMITPDKQAELGEDFSGVDLETDSGGGPARFKIRAKSTIPSDGRGHQVVIATAVFAAEQSLESIPLVSPHVYRKGKMRNTTEAPLLPGKVRVFRNNAFVGDAQLSMIAPGQEFDLYFGADGRITVFREEIKDTEREKGGLSKKNTVVKAWKTTITSYTSIVVPFYLVDQMPVSDVEEVRVRITDETQPSPLKVEDGIVRWLLEPEVGEGLEVIFEYEVSADAKHKGVLDNLN